MAIFQTGAVTSIPNLLDTIAQFAAANGWNVNQNAVEGNGRRVHLQLGSDVFINLRALVGENTYTGNGQVDAYNISGLLMNGSTGYDGGLAWNLQPGKPYYDSNNGQGHVAKRVGMVGIAGAMPAYYLFARGSMIYCWLEYATGQYQWLAFGRITKTSTWAGGAITCGSNYGFSNDIQNYAGFANQNAGNTRSCGYNPYGYMYGTIDGLTGWLSANNEGITPAMPKFFDSIADLGVSSGNMANAYNNQAVLTPIDICVTRQGAANRDDNSLFSIEGKLTDVYFCNIRNLVPAQQLDDGSGDTFRIFPFRQKGNDGYNVGTGWWGVAIKEN